ncbi:MAG TPA: hypothetical protein VIN08_05755 [Ohtaekwangia sp.]|uniref:hypothetical protein n=1 Tax=Ohtaekwangia sp. TaxID=2066019 RepID=UPI002F92D8D2
MKTIVFACFMIFGAAAVLNAQDTTSMTRDKYRQDAAKDQDHKSQDNYTDKDVIAASELPANIRQQLQSGDYSAYTVSKAYRKTKDGQTLYAVELSRGNEKKKVKFDAQGNILKEKTKGKDNQ